MRALVIIAAIAVAVLLGGWWLMGNHHASAYAPREAQDSELAVQPATEPAPPPPTPTDFKSDSSANLPAAPIPYDQLNKTEDGAPPADPNAPPEKKSNDKAIFY